MLKLDLQFRQGIVVKIICAVFGFCAGMAVTSVALALDMSAVPFISERTKESIEKHFSSTGRDCKLSYTVVVAKSGVWSSYCGGKLPKDDVRRIALEKCEHMAQETCGMVVVDGRVVEFDESPWNILYPETFSAASVPFIATKDRKQLKIKYGNAYRHKALAISRNGAYGYVTGRSSESEAKRLAVSFCEKHDRRRKRCFIYAVGPEVVFDMFTNIKPER